MERHAGAFGGWDRWFLLTGRRFLVIVLAWILAVVFHNAVYALLADTLGPGGDEPFFFLLAVVVIPLYFAASLVYTVAKRLRAGRR